MVDNVCLVELDKMNRGYSARFFLGMVIRIDAITSDASGATASGSTAVEIAHIAIKPLTAFTVAASQSLALPRR